MHFLFVQRVIRHTEGECYKLLLYRTLLLLHCCCFLGFFIQPNVELLSAVNLLKFKFTLKTTDTPKGCATAFRLYEAK